MLENKFSTIEQTEVIHEVLTLVSKHNLRTSIGAFSAISLLFVIGYHQVEMHWIIAWLIFAVSAQLNRIYALRRPFPNDYENLIKRKQYYLLAALLAGTSHISYLLFFPALTEVERSVVSLVFLGLCSGSTANNAGLREGFLCFSIPLIVALTIAWSVTDFASLPKWLGVSMAILMLFYGSVLNEMSKNTSKMIEETFLLRFKDRQQKNLLEKALEQAETANKTKTRFLAAASHDLRQPLHTISLVSATLGLHKLQKESQKLVEILNKVSMSLSAQLNDLLDISKLDAGIVEVNIQPTFVNTIIKNIVSEFELQIKEKNLRVVLKLKSEYPAAVDPHLLYRVLRNLTHNAIKFTDKGHIIFMTHDTDNCVVIEIVDTGCGVDTSHQQEVFQEFYQINNERRDRTKGFGLGLSIVARLTKLLNIDIQLKSSLQLGSSFILKVPKSTNIQDNAIETNFDVKHSKTRFSLNVLIVDDEKLIRSSTRLLLEKLGCKCTEAIDTPSTKKVIAEQMPDLVLADYRLGNGDTGIIAIEAVHELSDVPAVLITGDTAPNLLTSIQASGLRILHKPLSFEGLHAELILAQKIKDARLNRKNQQPEQV